MARIFDAFYTPRHRNAMEQYHKTRSLLYIQKRLGRKGAQQLLRKLAGSTSTGKTAIRTVEEARKLIEARFEHVCDIDEFKLFKRQK